jgi:hypothetical protein
MTTILGKYFAEGPPGFLQFWFSAELAIKLVAVLPAQADKAKAGKTAALAVKNFLLLFMSDSSKI